MKRTQIRPISKSTLISNGEVSKELKFSGGRTEVEKTGSKWGKTKMPRSFQQLVPRYSLSKGRFDLDGLEDDELQELVKLCRLKYERGPREGEYITEAFPTDEEDPFFRHKKMFIRLTEGGGNIRENPIDRIMYAHLRTRPEFRMPDNNMKMAGVSQQYEIIDEEFDQRHKNEEAKKVVDTFELLINTNEEKKSKIMTILGMRNDGTLDRDTLNTVLFSYIQESKTNSDTFREICKLPNDQLNLKYYIKDAMNENKITQPLSGGFLYNGETRMGRSMEDVELFLVDPENKDILEAIMNKKKTKTKK